MTPIDPNHIPDAMLRCMGKKHRPKGNAGLTMEEAGAKQAKVLESKVQNQIAGWLRIRGIFFIQSRMDRKTSTRKGTPDFCFVVMGHGDVGDGERPTVTYPLAIEVKTLSRMRPDQEQVRSQMEENGWNYYVVGSLEEVKKIVDGL